MLRRDEERIKEQNYQQVNQKFKTESSCAAVKGRFWHKNNVKYLQKEENR